ncbi:MAG: hypothetical protein K5868_09790 [Lachnospiraceae bacterium]|nr:hypothetical protein [Lachnospiraceae bacterium]
MDDKKITDKNIHKNPEHSGHSVSSEHGARPKRPEHPEHPEHKQGTGHPERTMKKGVKRRPEHPTQGHNPEHRAHSPEHQEHSPEHPVHGHGPEHQVHGPEHPAGKPSVIDRIKRICRMLWREYRFETIAVGVLVVAVAVAVPLIVHTVRGNRVVTPQAANPEEFGDVFAGGEGNGKSYTNEDGVRVRVDEATGEEVEDPTVLAEVKGGVGDGYLNNCIFLGDSRYVGLVSYAVISDEDVLAQVGIAHPSVESFTFTQNSGKQYTLKSYLTTHAKKVIYIGYGVNGMKGADEATYEKQYKTLVEHIMEMAPDSKIVLMSIWPVDDNGTYKGSVKNEWIEKYNEFLVTLAEYEGIYYLDVASVLKDKNGSINSHYDGGDGLHYNAKGYEAIRSYILSHPVPGVPTDGSYTVHYVPPTGQFKDMVKDKVAVPTSAPSPSPEATHEHSYTDHTETIEEATCEHGGKIRKYCSCGSYIEEETSSVDHKYVDGKCKWCGKTDPNASKAETPGPTPTPTPTNPPANDSPAETPTETPTDTPTETPTDTTTEPTSEPTPDTTSETSTDTTTTDPPADPPPEPPANPDTTNE